MLNNIDLEKKINSELNTKVSSSKIAHKTLLISLGIISLISSREIIAPLSLPPNISLLHISITLCITPQLLQAACFGITTLDSISIVENGIGSVKVKVCVVILAEIAFLVFFKRSLIRTFNKSWIQTIYQYIFT